MDFTSNFEYHAGRHRCNICEYMTPVVYCVELVRRSERSDWVRILVSNSPQLKAKLEERRKDGKRRFVCFDHFNEFQFSPYLSELGFPTLLPQAVPEPYDARTFTPNRHNFFSQRTLRPQEGPASTADTVIAVKVAPEDNQIQFDTVMDSFWSRFAQPSWIMMNHVGVPRIPTGSSSGYSANIRLKRKLSDEVPQKVPCMVAPKIEPTISGPGWNSGDTVLSAPCESKAMPIMYQYPQTGMDMMPLPPMMMGGNYGGMFYPEMQLNPSNMIYQAPPPLDMIYQAPPPFPQWNMLDCWNQQPFMNWSNGMVKQENSYEDGIGKTIVKTEPGIVMGEQKIEHKKDREIPEKKIKLEVE